MDSDEKLRPGQFSLRALMLFVALWSLLTTCVVNYPEWIPLVIIVLAGILEYMDPGPLVAAAENRLAAALTVGALRRLLAAACGGITGGVVLFILLFKLLRVLEIDIDHWSCLKYTAALGTALGLLYPKVFLRIGIPCP